MVVAGVVVAETYLFISLSLISRSYPDELDKLDAEETRRLNSQ